ncbi:MAG: arginine--tRNA ligase [Patescibacteria group bacterium]
MVFLKEKIRELVAKAATQKFPGELLDIKVEYPGDPSHGDYSSNVALDLGKKMKMNPRALAQELAQMIQKPEWIEKIETAGAGFLNFYLAPKFFEDFLDEVKKAGDDYGKSEVGKGKTVVTDTSHPNVAKPMGVHHLLSTIIGNAISRILAAVGYTVVRDNYLGDYGTQFGKLLYAYKTWGDEATVKKDPIPELLKLYVKFHEEVEKDEQLEDKGRAEFKKLEQGDAQNRKLWKWVVELSLQEFQKIWDRLDVSFDFIHGESFYEDKMQAIVDMGTSRGIFVKGEKGALIAPLKDPNIPPCIIQKSDGASLYATRDLARIQYWEETWHPVLMLNVVDMAQELYFRQLFEVTGMLKLTEARNLHIAFGRMRFPEKRMSTRKGDIILLEELLDEAQALALKIVEEKNPDLPAAAKKEVAKKVGVGSVKYAVLAQNRLTDVTFTWDKMLSLEGNSAPYLQYAYARAKSILRKGSEKRSGKMALLHEPAELALARLLPKFPEVVALSAAEFKPNLIANYLFELASRFSSFYAACDVLNAEPEVREARLKLVEAFTVVTKNGLKLLGIQVNEEM